MGSPLNPQSLNAHTLKFLLYSLFLKCTASASPTSTTSPVLSVSPTLTFSNSSSTPQKTATPESLSYDEESTKHAFNYYFVVSVVIATFFCILALYLQRRRKLRMNKAKRNVEDVVCRSRAGTFMIEVPPISPTYQCRVQEQREENIYEGLNEQGEAPPPYVSGPKPSNAGETSELENVVSLLSQAQGNTSASPNSGLVSPPAYEELASHVNSDNPGDIGLARPVPMINA